MGIVRPRNDLSFQCRVMNKQVWKKTVSSFFVSVGLSIPFGYRMGHELQVH